MQLLNEDDVWSLGWRQHACGWLVVIAPPTCNWYDIFDGGGRIWCTWRQVAAQGASSHTVCQPATGSTASPSTSAVISQTKRCHADAVPQGCLPGDGRWTLDIGLSVSAIKYLCRTADADKATSARAAVVARNSAAGIASPYLGVLCALIASNELLWPIGWIVIFSARWSLTEEEFIQYRSNMLFLHAKTERNVYNRWTSKNYNSFMLCTKRCVDASRSITL